MDKQNILDVFNHIDERIEKICRILKDSGFEKDDDGDLRLDFSGSYELSKNRDGDYVIEDTSAYMDHSGNYEVDHYEFKLDWLLDGWEELFYNDFIQPLINKHTFDLKPDDVVWVLDDDPYRTRDRDACIVERVLGYDVVVTKCNKYNKDRIGETKIVNFSKIREYTEED